MGIGSHHVFFVCALLLGFAGWSCAHAEVLLKAQEVSAPGITLRGLTASVDGNADGGVRVHAVEKAGGREPWGSARARGGSQQRRQPWEQALLAGAEVRARGCVKRALAVNLRPERRWPTNRVSCARLFSWGALGVGSDMGYEVGVACGSCDAFGPLGTRFAAGVGASSASARRRGTKELASSRRVDRGEWHRPHRFSGGLDGLRHVITCARSARRPFRRVTSSAVAAGRWCPPQVLGYAPTSSAPCRRPARRG